MFKCPLQAFYYPLPFASSLATGRSSLVGKVSKEACSTPVQLSRLTLRLTAARLSVAEQLSALTSLPHTTDFFSLLFHSSAQYYASRMVHFDSHNQRQWYEMSWSSMVWLSVLLAPVVLVTGQQQCYFGPGATNRGPPNLVPCNGTGASTCCLLGDTCLSGNACYNYATGDLYQYGCTDITYEDETCPYKCGWSPTLSPWTALEYCLDLQDTANTWVCHAPESCGCEWNSTYDLLVLQPIGCQEMGSNARVAIYAPSTLAPYVSLPSTIGGSTGYYSTTIISGTSTWVSTAIAGYTPSSFTQLTTYRAAPTSAVLINEDQTPAPSTYSPARSYTPTATASAAASSYPSTPKNYSPTMTSGTTPTLATSNSTTPSSGLSTGAKAGIGVGVAAGICLFAALGWIIFLMGKRHRERRLQQPQPQYGQGPQYPQSPPMPTEGLQYPQGPPMQGSHWTPYLGGPTPYHDVPAMYVDETRGMKPLYSPPASHQASPPVELSIDNERNMHEMGSDVSAVSPPTPTPAYAYTERPQM